jgi:putative transposase
MPRKLVILQNEFPYHVFNRSHDKHFFQVPLPELWELFIEEISRGIKIYEIQLQSFVLMGNHYHMILSTPNQNLSSFMQYFQSRVARKLSIGLGKNSFRFQARYKWSMITDPGHYKNVFSYVYLNPVRANICQKVEDYAFSTIQSYETPHTDNFRLHYHPYFEKCAEMSQAELIRYLNDSNVNHFAEKIRIGLKKKVFEIGDK